MKQTIKICLVLSLLYAALFSLPATSSAAPALQHSWDMNTDPGWTTEGLWAYGRPTGEGGQYGGPDPSSGYTGSSVYGYNLFGDYENDLPERHLTSTPIDCTGLSQVTLMFQRWLGVEEWFPEDGGPDHAYISVSNDGIVWTTIWDNQGTEFGDISWSLQELNISSIADGQSTVYLRWTIGPTDDAWQYCGWNIDDVEIWAEAAPQSCPECSGPRVTLENVTFPSGRECECTASVSITIGTGVTVETGATITFQAPMVKVQPGFHAEDGALVRIKSQKR